MFKRTRTRLTTNKSKTSNLKPSSNGDYYENQNRLYSAQQSFDRYSTLARDALTMGDRVIAEGYYQHAEHYLRLINGARQPSMPQFSINTPLIPPRCESESEGSSLETDNCGAESHLASLILKDLSPSPTPD